MLTESCNLAWQPVYLKKNETTCFLWHVLISKLNMKPTANAIEDNTTAMVTSFSENNRVLKCGFAYTILSNKRHFAKALYYPDYSCNYIASPRPKKHFWHNCLEVTIQFSVSYIAVSPLLKYRSVIQKWIRHHKLVFYC